MKKTSVLTLIVILILSHLSSCGTAPTETQKKMLDYQTSEQTERGGFDWVDDTSREITETEAETITETETETEETVTEADFTTLYESEKIITESEETETETKIAGEEESVTEDENDSVINDVEKLKFKTKEEINEILKNYSIVIETDFSMGTNIVKETKSRIAEMRCDEGYALGSFGSLTFIDYNLSKMYTLDTTEKTGYVQEYKDKDKYKYSNEHMSYYLFFHLEDTVEEGFISGYEKIMGRETTVYTLIDNKDIKYITWIDNEYCISLKMMIIIEESDFIYSMEAISLEVGTVSFDNMVNLKNYKIYELKS